MSAPAYSKLPTEEPMSPAGIPTPDSPVYVESPSAPHTVPPTVSNVIPVLPPSYPTVHRPPPPGSICTTTESSDDDVKTININITINIPSSFKFPCFRRHCRRDPAYATSTGTQIPRAEKKRRFLTVLLAFAYFTFLLCAAVAWGLRNKHHITEYSPVPLGIATLTAPIELFIVGSTILIARRFSEHKRPGPVFAMLSVILATLFILHVVIIIIAAGPWTHTFGYGWYYASTMKPVVGLTLYSVSGMTAVKLLLAIWTLKRLSPKNGALKTHLRAFRDEFRQCVGEESNQAEEGDARRSQEGSVFLA
ncbi:hypothetical protein TWF730_007964 [Orbilia blumenaviensis]|uniref:Uncharacterized protein n=1 Tax=Orbilia blumenaviensis TaxID=1796055 RepID=A0AAV9VCL8_9PEZI